VQKARLLPIKINVVVQRSGHIVRLIEFMDVGNRNGWKMEQVVPSLELLHTIQARWSVRAVGKNYPGEVASRYEYEDGAGEVGFISSVTEPFCGACSRARLSADGNLYTCLFATDGRNLMEPLRNGADDAELAEIVANVWRSRKDRYSEVREVEPMEKPLINKVEMYRMGG